MKEGSRHRRTLSGLVAALALAAAMPAIGANVRIEVLSNRADMISGGDALVEIVPPAGVTYSTPVFPVKATVDGVPVPVGTFAKRADGRVYGLLTGLKDGPNVLKAVLPGGGAQITITNHSFEGPIFSGTPIAPWICARPTATSVPVTVPGTSLSAMVTSRASTLAAPPVDDTCSGPTKFSYYYMPKAFEGFVGCTFAITGGNRCFVPYSLGARPADDAIADFTNDRGDKMKALLRVELGTVNRGMYEIVSWFDPAQPWAPWAPQKGWNRKLMFKMGYSLSGNRFQDVPDAGRKQGNSGGLYDVDALRAGFIVAHAELTDHFSSNNEVLAAEAMMMVKEHIIESYGEIRYTMSNGQSGGSMMQTVIATVMPGLIDGLMPAASYPDATSGFFLEARDCGQLVLYYQTPSGSALSNAKRAAINGDPTEAWCPNWQSRYINPQDPRIASNCGTGFPTSIVYSATRPQGVRCSTNDNLVPIWGTFVDIDGATKTRLPYDNVGVQYGLKALKNGVISAEEFVRLNEGVGSYNADMVWSGGTATAPVIPASRQRADLDVLAATYKSGLIADGIKLATVPIIDLRADNGTPDLHERWKSWATRERLDRAAGGHGNHIIRAFGGIAPGGPPGVAAVRQAFGMMDRWLTAIENDTSVTPLAQKVVNNKPADVTDACFVQPGNTDAQLINIGLDSATCPIKPEASPRQIAGGPLAEDILKCQLKPLNFADADYAGVTFTPDQQTRLNVVFAGGVCDWSKPGVGQQPSASLTFQAGPLGQPLPPAPVSTPL